MKVPNLSIGQFTDKEGHLTPEAKNFFALLIQNMQADISDEGFQIPSQIETGPNPDVTTTLTAAPNGRILYDSTNDQLKAKVGGAIKVIQVV